MYEKIYTFFMRDRLRSSRPSLKIDIKIKPFHPNNLRACVHHVLHGT